ncbi:hypothetical protein ACTWQB_08125 [Piscibacillus sp. B03]|uniref:hypothetical protein n=1 Tax=Piscibacillus sp. B03 TaxID=3457430 RepID=UPI003FCCEE69
MGIERKEIIINEIKHWKETKLLPERYCDFLLMLYTQGEDQQETTNTSKPLGSIWFVLDLFFLMLLLPVTSYFLLIETTDLWLKITLILITIIIAIVHILYFYKNKSLVIHIPIIVLFTTLLTGSIAFNAFFVLSMYWVIAFHCFMWIIVGYWKKLYYLIISGVLGLIILLINYFVI